MKHMQGYKFRLEPKFNQIDSLINGLGCNRFIWNKLLAMNLYRLKNKFPLLWYNEMAWFITFWKQAEEYSFLKEAPSQSLQQTAKALDRAFRDAFDKNQPQKKLPVFKRLGKNEASLVYPQSTVLDTGNKVIKVPKIGWIKYRPSQKVEGNIKNVRISRKRALFTLSIQTEREVVTPSHPAKGAVGIDLGVINFATLSNGEAIEPKNAFRQREDALVIEQKKAKNKVKFSNNWKKQQDKISNIHQKIAHIREDFLHKVSTRISKNHAMIVVENLKITNMSKSAKGDLEHPGKNIKQKSGLNKAILDQGWGTFRSYLSYKQAWRGGLLLTVAPHYTSQTCPVCYHVDKANRKTQALFACAYENNADVVGAMNILRAGHAQLACEVSTETDCASSRNQPSLKVSNL